MHEEEISPALLEMQIALKFTVHLTLLYVLYDLNTTVVICYQFFFFRWKEKAAILQDKVTAKVWIHES